jgi:hypothetical protein
MISIISDETKVTDAGTYRRFEVQTTRRHVVVTVFSGFTSYIRVLVPNASNRAWGGMGRQFWSFEEAIEAYKTEEIRSSLLAISEVCNSKTESLVH